MKNECRTVIVTEPQEKCRDLLGRIVVLTGTLTRGDRQYEAGTRFRVEKTWRGTFTLDRVDADNQPVYLAEGPGWHVRESVDRVRRYQFRIEEAGLDKLR